jgi:hypothetical protein
MLFKTLSAAVFGIDAYLVKVEADAGSARMNDFNVVGLPDNAVKERRERIKSALRNCEARRAMNGVSVLTCALLIFLPGPSQPRRKRSGGFAGPSAQAKNSSPPI